MDRVGGEMKHIHLILFGGFLLLLLRFATYHMRLSIIGLLKAGFFRYKAIADVIN